METLFVGDKQELNDLKEHHKNNTVHFELDYIENKLVTDKEAYMKKMKLRTTM